VRGYFLAARKDGLPPDTIFWSSGTGEEE